MKVDNENNEYKILDVSDVLTPNGWKSVKQIKIGDTICGDTTTDVVKNINLVGNYYILCV